jgi:predicted lipid-binding transport protein (Tim44 family)
MQEDKFDRIIAFLLGASYSILVIGVLIIFKLFSSFGFIISFFITILYIIFALFLILALDAFQINRQRLEEEKKQTKLLEKIESFKR